MGAGPGDVPDEIYFEFRTLGALTRVAAIDAATGTEVSVMGPATAAPGHLQQLALAKLKAKLAKPGS